MRKWVSVAEVVILAAMLVFVIGFSKYYKQPIYIKNRWMPAGASWDGSNLVESKDSCFERVDFYDKEAYKKYMTYPNEDTKIYDKYNPWNIKRKMFFESFNEISDTPVLFSTDTIMSSIDNLGNITFKKIYATTKEITVKNGETFMIYYEIKAIRPMEQEYYFYKDNGKLFSFRMYQANKIGKETIRFEILNGEGKLEINEITVKVVVEQ